MRYEDFEKIIGKEINVGDTVYITDYRFNDYNNKPIRHVEPQKVMLFSNIDLPKNKKVYYANYHFRPINKDGKPKSQIIAPFDNTGYRSYTGVSINVFFNENECKEFYLQQCTKHIEGLNRFKDIQLQEIGDKIKDIEGQIFKFNL